MIYRTIAKKEPQELFSYVTKMSGLFAGLMFFPMVVLFFWGDILFDLVFGSGWGTANGYAQILAALAAGNMMMLPVVGALPVLKMMRSFLLAELAGLILRVATLFFISWDGPLEAVIFSTLSYMAVLAIFYIFFVRKLFYYSRKTQA